MLAEMISNQFSLNRSNRIREYLQLKNALSRQYTSAYASISSRNWFSKVNENSISFCQCSRRLCSAAEKNTTHIIIPTSSQNNQAPPTYSHSTTSMKYLVNDQYATRPRYPRCPESAWRKSKHSKTSGDSRIEFPNSITKFCNAPTSG